MTTASPEPQDVEAVEATERAEAGGGPGIYAYTLPLYAKHPDDRGRFPIKVGYSGVSARDRFQGQGRLT